MGVLFYLRSHRHYILVSAAIMAVFFLIIILCDVLIDSGRSFLLKVRWTTYLSVTFVSDGNWTVHIENIARSALKQVNVLVRLKFRSYIYQTSTRICMWSVGWVLWTGHWKIRKNTIRSGTNCNRSDKFASKDSLYFETGWETLANRRETRKLTTFL